MKQIQFTKTFAVEKKKLDPLGDAISDFFGKSLYWVHKKFNRARVERCFDIAQKNDDRDFTHFMQNIYKS